MTSRGASLMGRRVSHGLTQYGQVMGIVLRSSVTGDLWTSLVVPAEKNIDSVSYQRSRNNLNRSVMQLTGFAIR